MIQNELTISFFFLLSKNRKCFVQGLRTENDGQFDATAQLNLFPKSR